MSSDRVNMAELARVCGFHKSTVSRALRNDLSISPETRKRVQEAALRIGYKPHPLLSTVMSVTRAKQAHRPVGETYVWVVEDDRETLTWRNLSYIAPYFLGARKRAEELGRKLEILSAEKFLKARPGMAGVEAFAKMLQARGIKGLILPGINNAQLLRYAWDDFSVVEVNSEDGYWRADESGPDPEPSFHTVMPDRYHNTLDLVNALYGRGYERVGLFSSSYIDYRDAGLSRAAYLIASQNHNRWIPPLIREFDPKPPHGQLLDYLGQWVREHRLDAVITFDGRSRQWLESLGYRIPQDLGLAHQNLADDVEDWTGVDRRMEVLGSLAMDVLASAVQRNDCGRSEHSPTIFVRGKVILGKTTTDRRSPAAKRATRRKGGRRGVDPAS